MLNLFFNQLTNLILPDDLMNLGTLDLDFNQFADLDLPPQLVNVRTLKLRSNLLTDFSLPASMTQLRFLDIGENRLDNVQLPAGLDRLEFLRLSGNTNLTSLTLPVGLTNLTGLFLRFNQLTNLTLPSDLANLVQIDVLGNKLTSLSLPAGLTNLITLVPSGNQLTNLTLPPDMTRLASLVLNGNPPQDPRFIRTAGHESRRNSRVAAGGRHLRFNVSSHSRVGAPADIHRSIPVWNHSAPGVYWVLASTNLADWEVLGTAENPLGSISFNDISTNLISHKFYRVLLQTPPANMVFIPPDSFIMGSPANEQDRQTNEGPQTIMSTRPPWTKKRNQRVPQLGDGKGCEAARMERVVEHSVKNSVE